MREILGCFMVEFRSCCSALGPLQKELQADSSKWAALQWPPPPPHHFLLGRAFPFLCFCFWSLSICRPWVNVSLPSARKICFSLNSLSLELFLFASVATVQSPPLNEEFSCPCQILESHLPCESTLLPALSFLRPAWHWAPDVYTELWRRDRHYRMNSGFSAVRGPALKD